MCEDNKWDEQKKRCTRIVINSMQCINIPGTMVCFISYILAACYVRNESLLILLIMKIRRFHAICAHSGTHPTMDIPGIIFYCWVHINGIDYYYATYCPSSSTAVYQAGII